MPDKGFLKLGLYYMQEEGEGDETLHGSEELKSAKEILTEVEPAL